MGEAARRLGGKRMQLAAVAQRYAEFLESVVGRGDMRPSAAAASGPAQHRRRRDRSEWHRSTSRLGPTETARRAISTRISRDLAKTLEITPPGGPDDRILEMGAYLQITPALKTKLGYGEVRGCYYGPAGHVEHRHSDVASTASNSSATWICSMPRRIAFRTTTILLDGVVLRAASSICLKIRCT